MKIAVVGFATDGRVSADYFARRGDQVMICDQDETIEVPTGYERQLGPTYLHDMDRFDLIVRSSGIHPDVILKDNPDVAGKITTSIDEFLSACPTRHTIGITGTKGKGTTSTLVTKILEAAGHTVHLGGNIGRSPLSFIHDVKPEDWVVLELSSFQLIDSAHSPHIAVCLMVVPEHLNWHADMDDYMAAKSRLFAWQNSDDVAIYFAENERSRHIAHAGAGRKLPYFASPGAWVNGDMITIDGQEVCRTDEIKLLGKHNWQNVCAAVTTVWQAGVHDLPAIRSVLTTFSGLPHRIELVREVDGVRYYNDSFATGLHATMAAIDAIPEEKVMILGGYDRMLPLDHFATFVADHAENFRKLLLIGASSQRLASALEATGFTNFLIDTKSKTMPAIVTAARELAKDGDAIVLSPGFASYDMFKNFEDRGLKYKAAVEAL